MRKLVVGTFVTIDGVMQGPGGPDEDREGGFEYGGWSVNYWDEEMGRLIAEATLRAGGLLLGRKTYEIFAAHWPYSQEPGADSLNNATKHVASSQPMELSWQNSKLIEGSVPDGVRALKEQDGPELQVHGSSNLLQTLLEHDLIDEFQIMIFPLVLGTGKRLFDGGTIPAGLELTASRVSSTGVFIGNYRTGAEIKSGSFALDEPSEAERARRAAQES
jgi:dihydrofolate reductase